MKSKYLIWSVIILVFFGGLTLFNNLSNNNKPLKPNENPSQQNNTFHLSEQLNEESMSYLPRATQIYSKEKFQSNNSDLKSKNCKVEVTVKFDKQGHSNENIGVTTDNPATLNGSIFIGKRAFGFSGSGNFSKFNAPDTEELYYFGHIEGELKGINMNKNEPNYKEYDNSNSFWIVVFNPETKEAFISSSVGFQSYTGALMFGNNKLVSNEYYSAFLEQEKSSQNDALQSINNISQPSSAIFQSKRAQSSVKKQTEDVKIWYKDSDDSDIYRRTTAETGDYTTDTEDLWATLVAHAYYDTLSHTGYEWVRVFAREDPVTKLWYPTGVGVSIYSANAALKRIDNRYLAFSIDNVEPNPQSTSILPKVSWLPYEVLGLIPNPYAPYASTIATVLSNSYSAGIDYWRPDDSLQWKVRSFNNSGLDWNTLSLPQDVNKDYIDQSYDNQSKGFVARFKYSLDSSYENYNLRAWGQIYYKAHYGYGIITYQSGYPTVDHTVYTTQ